MEYEDRMTDFIIDCIFLVDILLHFLRAYYSDVEVVTSFSKISLKYLTGLFFFDVLATFPTLCTYEWKVLYWFKLVRIIRAF